MTGACRIALAAGLLSLVLAESTPAYGRDQSCWSHTGPVYGYYYPPLFCYPVMPAPRPSPTLAAPPSGGFSVPQRKEPPLGKPPLAKPPVEKEPPWDKPPLPKEPPVGKPPPGKPPTVIESRTQGSNYPAAREHCRVGFWNLTGRDVILKINGQTRQLAKDRALTVEVERAFTWQVDQQEPTSERVAESQAFHEVILRK